MSLDGLPLEKAVHRHDAAPLDPYEVPMFFQPERTYELPSPGEGRAMERKDLLTQISFGARVAEDETSELASYFVETDQWGRLFRGEVDIIKGEKGAGKSAIYSLLVAKAGDLFDGAVAGVVGK
jgi:hypothetical protein